jgi:hypothetical protein
MTIALHHRRNYERTDETLDYVRGLIAALDACLENVPSLRTNARETVPVWVLMGILGEKIDALMTARQMEWVGLGGVSDDLTKKQKREAKPKK